MRMRVFVVHHNHGVSSANEMGTTILDSLGKTRALRLEIWTIVLIDLQQDYFMRVDVDGYSCQASYSVLLPR